MSNDRLTVAQTAQYVQVYDKTVRRFISKNELIASKNDDFWRIQKKDIDSYLKANRNNNN
ncbi:MAG: helix-turn-helix domain-containing protein [Oscillospiraceae bacterium]